MRTTVTLDPDTEALIRRRMAERAVSFKQALNDAIREGARPAPRSDRPVTNVVAMGRPRLDLDRALQIAAELEDDELIHKMRQGS
jgi:hypothetical protein